MMSFRLKYRTRNRSCPGHGPRICAARTRGLLHAALLGLTLLFAPPTVFAADRYTDKQLDALDDRVGKMFWLNPATEKMPSFLTDPTPNAATFQPTPKASFEITELTGRAAKDPYYKVKFDSGKIGYIRPEAFLEEFNATILSVDPQAGEKKLAEEQSAEEKKRLEWISSQPWSPQVKQAAINKQPTPGLNTGEVKRVMGAPRRVTKVRGLSKTSEEHWFYPDGLILIFNNGLLSRIDKSQTK